MQMKQRLDVWFKKFLEKLVVFGEGHMKMCEENVIVLKE